MGVVFGRDSSLAGPAVDDQLLFEQKVFSYD